VGIDRLFYDTIPSQKKTMGLLALFGDIFVIFNSERIWEPRGKNALFAFGSWHILFDIYCTSMSHIYLHIFIRDWKLACVDRHGK